MTFSLVQKERNIYFSKGEKLYSDRNLVETHRENREFRCSKNFRAEYSKEKMSAKKKRRKSIVVNPHQKQNHCGPECRQQERVRELTKPKIPFGQRLNTPLLIDLDSDKKKPIAEHGEEATIEVYTAGICHQTIFEGLIFENEMMMVIEGNREATTSRDALVELINFCEEEMNFETFIIAIPRKRHDHREFVGRLTNFLDFKMIRPYAGWTEDFIYVALEL